MEREDKMGSHLKIVLKGGIHLVAKDRGNTSDPYCEFALLNSSGHHVGKKRKSKVVKKNLNPQWHETFQFDIPEDIDAVRVRCFDKDRLGKDFMGQVVIPMDVVRSQRGEVKSWELRGRKASDKVSGELCFSLEYSGEEATSPGASMSSERAQEATGAGHAASQPLAQSVAMPPKDKKPSLKKNISAKFRKHTAHDKEGHHHKSSKADKGKGKREMALLGPGHGVEDEDELSEMGVQSEMIPAPTPVAAPGGSKHKKSRRMSLDSKKTTKDKSKRSHHKTKPGRKEKKISASGPMHSPNAAPPLGDQKPSSPQPDEQAMDAASAAAFSLGAAPVLMVSASASTPAKDLLSAPEGQPSLDPNTNTNMMKLAFSFDENNVFIKIFECKNLDALDACGTSDPYVVIKYGDVKKKTKKFKKELNPVFNEEFHLKRKPDVETIKVKVYDFDVIGKDDLIGTLLIEVKGKAQQERTVWEQLSVKKGIAANVIRKRSMPVPPAGKTVGQDGRLLDVSTDSGGSSKKGGGSVHTGDIVLDVNYYPGIKSTFGTSDGILVVTIVECQNLIPKNPNAMYSDPYVVLKWGEYQEERTSPVKKSLNPVFGDQFDFQMKGDVNKLLVEVWNWDRLGAHDLVGSAVINTGDLTPMPESNHQVLALKKEERKRPKVGSRRSKAQTSSTDSSLPGKPSSSKVQRCAEKQEQALGEKRMRLLELCKKHTMERSQSLDKKIIAMDSRKRYQVYKHGVASKGSIAVLRSTDLPLALPLFLGLLGIGLLNVLLRLSWSFLIEALG